MSIWIVTFFEAVREQNRALRIVNTHWAVIDEGNVHHGSEDAVLDSFFFVEDLQLTVEGLVERPGLVTSGALVEVGLVSFLERSVQRELRDCPYSVMAVYMSP